MNTLHIAVSLLLQIFAVFHDGVSSTSASILTTVTSSVIQLDQDVIFYLYCCKRVNAEYPEKIYVGNDAALSDSCFNASFPTKFLIHGWTNDVNSPMCVTMREAYCDVGEDNVIVIDWSVHSRKEYSIACSKIKEVGEYVGLLIDFLVEKGKMIIAELMIIGHSLGAYVAGTAARSSKSTVKSVIGLDPAGPDFYIDKANVRLRPTDADCVKVIHTSAYTLGYGGNLGDSDIWVNGGYRQPGCGLDLGMICSHNRAFVYVAEAIRREFLAYYCTSYSNYKEGLYDSNNFTNLADCDPDSNAHGTYYVDTNSVSPFSKS